MDSEGKFWTAMWVLVLIGVVAIAGCITVGAMQANVLYYKAQSECVSHGGKWLPLANSSNVCLS